MSRHTFGFAVRALIFFLFSQAAPVAILLSALFSERYSLGESWAPGLSRSHLDSAAELGCSDQNFLGHGAHRFLAIVQWFVYLAVHPQPMEQDRQLPRHGHHCSLL